MKTCPDCHERKPTSEFHKCRTRPDGLVLYCKPCTAARQRLTRYGLTASAYKAMLRGQDGCCAICNEKCADGYRLSVDHCHETGEVRGLLCRSCNLAIGKLKDSPDLARRAADYLEGR